MCGQCVCNRRAHADNITDMVDQLVLRDVVQSFGKIRYLVFIQDRGGGGGSGGTFGKIKIQDSNFVYSILKLI